MEKIGSLAGTQNWIPFDSNSAARCVADDFRGLVAILGEHLESEFGEQRSAIAISKAKAAAERGLRLSQRLVELTRDAH